jgi:succinyl-diaminopimelate desuccinylase
MTGDAAVAEVGAFVERHRGDLLRLCRDLVAARSVNPPGRTVEAAAVVERFLAGFGIAPERVARDPEKPNLVATLGAGAAPHLVLNGHLDTVQPGDEAAWTVPLHELTERGGRLHGLGMGNMKGGVAALALAFAFLSRHRRALAGRVSLTLVADETVFGPDGAAFLLDTRPDLRGDMVLCGEGPGSMGLAVAEKGLLWLAVEARAPSGQGMLAERGSSAVARLAAFLTELDALNEVRAEPPFPLDPGEGGHGPRLSVNLGTVRGGRFFSQAADRAAAEVDLRVPPGLTTDGVEARVRALASRLPGVTVRRVKGWDPNWTDPASPLVRAVAAAAEAVRGTSPPLVTRLPASDASRWRALGVPAVCYGPQPTLASGVDDYANERDVADCAEVYALAALRLVGR